MSSAARCSRITLHNEGNDVKPINIAPKPSDGELTANPIIVRCELNCPAGRMYPPWCTPGMSAAKYGCRDYSYRFIAVRSPAESQGLVNVTEFPFPKRNYATNDNVYYRSF